MSLSGLDDAKVKEAYDAAVAEPGGWYAYIQYLVSCYSGIEIVN